MVGRKAKPDHLKVLEGTFRKDRAKPNAKKPATVPMSPPGWLPDECMPHFEKIKTLAGENGLDSTTFSNLTALAALRLHEVEACNRLILEHGQVYEGGSDSKPMLKANPAVSQRSEALRHLQSLFSELGLTPTSLAKVGVAPVVDEDEFPI